MGLIRAILLIIICVQVTKAQSDYIINNEKDTIYGELIDVLYTIGNPYKVVFKPEGKKVKKYGARKIIALKNDTNYWETGKVVMGINSPRVFALKIEESAKITKYEVTLQSGGTGGTIVGEGIASTRVYNYQYGNYFVYRHNNAYKERFYNPNYRGFKEMMQTCEYMSEKYKTRDYFRTHTIEEQIEDYENNCK